ncbi:hypothetical protein EB796_019958 [Bugula neritina]|uniref:Uncharacterized protein n=1 Tax=Bugula neritina TaxID=10212 RepID=A0A7J7J7U3_BUGNE|nr:hypothetical protein EB796_019958 [Bugula neritina]
MLRDTAISVTPGVSTHCHVVINVLAAATLDAVTAYNVKGYAERHVFSTPEMSIKTGRASGAVNTESVRGLVDCPALLCHVTTHRYDCQGMCGEPCPLMCFKCDQPREIENIRRHVSPQLADDISFLTKWILLADCMHLVPVEYMYDVVYRGPLASMIPCCPYRDCGKPVLNTRRYAAHTRPSNIGYSVDYHGPKNAGQENNSKKHVPIDIVFADLPMHHHQQHRNIPERSLTDPPNAPPLPPRLTLTSQNDNGLEKIQLQLKEVKIQNEIRQDFTLRNPDAEVSSSTEDSRLDWAGME